jgi:hypothetical protein
VPWKLKWAAEPDSTLFWAAWFPVVLALAFEALRRLTECPTGQFQQRQACKLFQ